ncbi:hypothetical protein [Paraburkholderia sp. MM5482-R1]|uniref:hypothetical protein n=1 Tax=unclassified Paraburkholderia TaxID=2615204 RepID=UPI003D19EB79
MTSHQYEQAALGYYKLDAAEPRIASKVAYCEWMLGHDEEAFDRLMSLGEELDADGVGLLSELIRTRYGDKNRSAHMEAIWARLKVVTTADSVPLLAAEARARGLWPGDAENREQRRREIERLLSLHPTSQRIRLEVLNELRCSDSPAEERYALLRGWNSSDLIPRFQWESACVAAEVRKFDEAIDYLRQLEKRERQSARPSQNLLLNIDLARCDITVRSADAPDLSGYDAILSGTTLDGENSARVVRAALAAACSFAPERVAELCDGLLNALKSTEYGFPIDASALFNESYPVSGQEWDDCAHTWPCGNLFPHQDILLATTRPRERVPPRRFRRVKN